MAARSVPRRALAAAGVAALAVAGLALALPSGGTRDCVTAPGAEGLAGLLATRDAAVRTHAGRAPGVTGSAGTLLARVRDVPVAAWESGAPTGVDAAADRVTGAVRLSYRLAGDIRPTTRDRLVTAVRRDGCWTLVGDVPAGGAVPDLWDLGDVRVATAPRAVVLASAGLGGAAAGRLAAEASDAAVAVDALWPGGLPSTTVLVAPRTDADAAGVAGTPEAALDGLAAVTFGPPSPNAAGPSAFGDVRVLVLPDGLAALTAQGRRFVLAHELTHAATNATARSAVPAWLQECFADVVGWSALGLTGGEVDRLVGDDLRAAGVRPGTLPAEPPSRSGFDPRTGDLDRAYALADAACLALTDGFRPRRLASVYAVAAGPPPGAFDAALAAAGTDAARFPQAWHRRVRDLVAGTDRQTAGSR